MTVGTPVQAVAEEQSRGLRQRDLIPPEKLHFVHALVVGVGAIGRQVALQLAAMGIRRMTLVDFDQVELVNLGPQGYSPQDIGRNKVEATADMCLFANPDCKIAAIPDRFRLGQMTNRAAGETKLSIRELEKNAVFCCVDKMDARKLVWDATKDTAWLFTDGRMAAEILRVFASAEPAKDEYYPKYLFPESEALPLSCTAKSTIYSANICAGIMVSQLVRKLRDQEVARDIEFALPSMEFSVR